MRDATRFGHVRGVRVGAGLGRPASQRPETAHQDAVHQADGRSTPEHLLDGGLFLVGRRLHYLQRRAFHEGPKQEVSEPDSRYLTGSPDINQGG